MALITEPPLMRCPPTPPIRTTVQSIPTKDKTSPDLQGVVYRFPTMDTAGRAGADAQTGDGDITMHNGMPTPSPKVAGGNDEPTSVEQASPLNPPLDSKPRLYTELTHIDALTSLKNTKLSELTTVQTDMRHLGHLVASLTVEIKQLQHGGDQSEIADAREKRHDARKQMEKLAGRITRLERKVGHVDWQIRGVMAEDERGEAGECGCDGWNTPRFRFVVQDYA